jgi:hypothetical protein
MKYAFEQPLEPFSTETQELAEEITGRAVRAMTEAGLGALEIAHALCHAGLDFLPAACCRECLEREYLAVVSEQVVQG